MTAYFALLMQIPESDDLMIKLVYCIQEEEHAHPVFMDVLQLENVGKQLENCLKKQYPGLQSPTKEFRIDLDGLLAWKWWPNFIRFYSKFR